MFVIDGHRSARCWMGAVATLSVLIAELATAQTLLTGRSSVVVRVPPGNEIVLSVVFDKDCLLGSLGDNACGALIAAYERANRETLGHTNSLARFLTESFDPRRATKEGDQYCMFPKECRYVERNGSTAVVRRFIQLSGGSFFARDGDVGRQAQWRPDTPSLSLTEVGRCHWRLVAEGARSGLPFARAEIQVVGAGDKPCENADLIEAPL